MLHLLAVRTQPYKPGKPDITLSAKELQQLRDGKLVRTDPTLCNCDCKCAYCTMCTLYALSHMLQVQQSLTVGDGQGRALAVQVQVCMSAYGPSISTRLFYSSM
jgi:hypothetical protein